MEPSHPLSKTICMPFESEAHYATCLRDTESFRRSIEQVLADAPELFPPELREGFCFYGSYRSRKQQIALRRIRLAATGDVFQIRPSFLMPYLIGKTDEVEKALYLRQFDVPFDALAYVFGRDPMYWYRAWCALGRPSIVGTTVKDPSKLPKHLVADEKHTWLEGEKVYVATTAAGGSILGAELTESASADALEKAYGVFAAEARLLDEDYVPETVCTDGWEATQSAWEKIFPAITVILCFLHSVLRLWDRCTKNRPLRAEVTDRAWRVYHAATRAQFGQRIRRFREWASAQLSEGPVREAVLKLCRRAQRFVPAFRFPEAHRTSNAVDRLMNHQDRHLYAMRYLHGTHESARLALRAMALLWNFHPYGARTRHGAPQRLSPFHDLNGFQYHDNWLQNLLVAASLGGRRAST